MAKFVRFASNNGTVQEKLYESYQQEQLVDVTFVCACATRVRAHSVVLSLNSPFFKQFHKELSGTKGYIFLPTVSADVLKHFLDFFYKGELTAEEQLVPEIQMLAQCFGIANMDIINPSAEGNSAESADDGSTTPDLDLEDLRASLVKKSRKPKRKSKKKSCNSNSLTAMMNNETATKRINPCALTRKLTSAQISSGSTYVTASGDVRNELLQDDSEVITRMAHSGRRAVTNHSSTPIEPSKETGDSPTAGVCGVSNTVADGINTDVLKNNEDSVVEIMVQESPILVEDSDPSSLAATLSDDKNRKQAPEGSLPKIKRKITYLSDSSDDSRTTVVRPTRLKASTSSGVSNKRPKGSGPAKSKSGWMSKFPGKVALEASPDGQGMPDAEQLIERIESSRNIEFSFKFYYHFCIICDKVFSSIRSHINRQHQTVRRAHVHCKQCKKTFFSKEFIEDCHKCVRKY